MFLKSFSDLNKKNKNLNHQSGFSLVELMVVIVIFTIITVTLMFNTDLFRDKTSLELVAQEVAITIRQAQSFGTAARRSGDDDAFSAFGINFPDGISSETHANFGRFILFADGNEDNEYQESEFDSDLFLTGSVRVKENGLQCYSPSSPGGNSVNCPIDDGGVSIVYRRGGSEASIGDGAYNRIDITLESTRQLDDDGNPLSRTIVVRSNGQIAVPAE